MFKVIRVLRNGDFVCREFIISGKVFRRHSTLQFEAVGVFNNHGFKTIQSILPVSAIRGKVFSMGSLLMTIPMNILLEK